MTRVPPTHEAEKNSEDPGGPASHPANIGRFHALDCVRASAILLGVFYHTIQFASFASGRFEMGGASMRLQGWLHCFRMPLFFLISGFFSAMMLEKYGVWRYLGRRWMRIGAPFAIGLVTLVPLYQWVVGLGGDRMRPGGGSISIRLDYLWFLWYLLVFITASPALAGIDRLLRRTISDLGGRLSRGSLRLDLAPLALGLLTGPALLVTPSWFGWSLPVAMGAFRPFPDFLHRLEPDMAFYFAYFAAGWWLFRLKEGLEDVARAWLPNLVLGLAAHAGAELLSGSYSMRRDLPHYEWVRLGGYLLYAMGAAYTAFGVLGLFVRFVDRPSRAGRYLADTAFWIYLIHMPILWPLLRAFAPWGLPWWVQGPLVTLITAGAALLLFEIVIRPTPLVWLFGPARPRRREVSPGENPGDLREVAHPTPE